MEKSWKSRHFVVEKCAKSVEKVDSGVPKSNGGSPLLGV